MEDEPASGDGPGPELPTTRKPRVERPPMMPDGPEVPFCPFRCQCHLRVAQCSDLGNHFIDSRLLGDMATRIIIVLAVLGNIAK